ncbi:MAG: LacI family transcriptional regulator [Vallitaleaceae bacterium]|nr:LacI family transcriptional regulator [Vallitaleaceae bacterium]
MGLNIQLVAKKCNVSVSTVSRVLNNSPSVADKTRKKVLAVIEELNYSPSKIARGLSSNGFDAILIVYTRASRFAADNPYFSTIVNAIGEVAEKHDYDLILQSSDSEEKEIEKSLSMIKSKLIKGIVVLSSRVNSRFIEALSTCDIPTVVIGKTDAHIDAPNIISVDTDNYTDCKSAGHYLINMGHTHIGCIHAPTDYYVSIDRINGFKQSIIEHGLLIMEEQFVDGGYTLDSAYDAAINLLCSKKITAIFATDDLKALGIYKAAKKLGLNIPQDISVVGHNDFEFSKLITPPLTTIRVPIYELGIIAGSKLFSMMTHHQKEDSQILPTEFLIRSSVVNNFTS